MDNFSTFEYWYGHVHTVELNLIQLVPSPTRPNLKYPDKSTLIDLILTNAPQKYSSVGVFSNDISDHCAVACIRDTRLPKSKPRILIKRNFKRFNDQAFLHDLNHCDFSRISIIPDVNTAWNHFRSLFLSITDKHAPLTCYRIKGRDNPWFSPELATLIHERNAAWALARNTASQSDWAHFRHLRNKCTYAVRKCKSDFFLNSLSSNLNNPSRFWKTIKSLEHPISDTTLPQHIAIDAQQISNKETIVNLFNKHFIKAGDLFEQTHSNTVSSSADYLSKSPTSITGDRFDFEIIPLSAVLKALKEIDPKKSSGPDGLDPALLKLAANIIAEPLAYIFNLSLSSNVIPDIWKFAHVLPLLKGGDPFILDNYRPISKLSVLAKILESLVNFQLKDFLQSHNILSQTQSGFRAQHSTISATTLVLNDIINTLDKKMSCPIY